MTHFADAAYKRSFNSKRAIALLILLGAAVSAQALPRQANDADVKSCRFLGWVSADSGYGKNHAWKDSAKSAALKDAERLGASDVVWARYTPVGSFNGMVDGRVYLCDQPVNTQANVAKQRNEDEVN